MKAFDNISTPDTKAQHHPDFILGWVGAAISVFAEVLPPPPPTPPLKITGEGVILYCLS